MRNNKYLMMMYNLKVVGLPKLGFIADLMFAHCIHLYTITYIVVRRKVGLHILGIGMCKCIVSIIIFHPTTPGNLVWWFSSKMQLESLVIRNPSSGILSPIKSTCNLMDIMTGSWLSFAAINLNRELVCV